MRLKEQWRDLTQAKPGTRFQNRYERRKDRRCSVFVKAWYMTLGAALLLAGIVLMPAPGPGILVALIGASTLAGESLVAARALDAAELKIRSALHRAGRLWQRASAGLKALVALGAASIAGLAGWGMYAVVFG